MSYLENNNDCFNCFYSSCRLVNFLAVTAANESNVTFTAVQNAVFGFATPAVFTNTLLLTKAVHFINARRVTLKRGTVDP